MFNFSCKKTVKEEVKKEVKKIVTSELFIAFSDGSRLSYAYTGKNKGIYPWRLFYKWFFSRDASEHYVFKTTEGHEMIRKDLIKSFRVNFSK